MIFFIFILIGIGFILLRNGGILSIAIFLFLSPFLYFLLAITALFTLVLTLAFFMSFII